MRYDMGLSVALGLALIFATAARVQSQTPDAQSAAANDGPGGAASWTTGNKLAVGTSAGLDSKVWFTVAKGITSEVIYPRLDVPNMEDMQYVVNGRLDLRRPRARRDKPCDLHAVRKGARVHRHEHGHPTVG